jgi:hypothetical protein
MAHPVKMDLSGTPEAEDIAGGSLTEVRRVADRTSASMLFKLDQSALNPDEHEVTGDSLQFSQIIKRRKFGHASHPGYPVHQFLKTLFIGRETSEVNHDIPKSHIF